MTEVSSSGLGQPWICVLKHHGWPSSENSYLSLAAGRQMRFGAHRSLKA